MMKYGRTYNFSAGPAMMPEEVLEEVLQEAVPAEEEDLLLQRELWLFRKSFWRKSPPR